MPVTPILYLTCSLQKHHQEMHEHTGNSPLACRPGAGPSPTLHCHSGHESQKGRALGRAAVSPAFTGEHSLENCLQVAQPHLCRDEGTFPLKARHLFPCDYTDLLCPDLPVNSQLSLIEQFIFAIYSANVFSTLYPLYAHDYLWRRRKASWPGAGVQKPQ